MIRDVISARTAESDEQAVRVLVKALDEYYGTPCEKVRHQQEVEKLERDRALLIDALRDVLDIYPADLCADSDVVRSVIDKAFAALEAMAGEA
jgi:hypothetical protein